MSARWDSGTVHWDSGSAFWDAATGETSALAMRPLALKPLVMRSLIALGLLAASATAQADNQLLWDASPSPNITEYIVYGSTITTNGFAPWVELGRVAATSETEYRYQHITGEQSWIYVVTATDGLRHSPPSNPAIKMQVLIAPDLRME